MTHTEANLIQEACDENLKSNDQINNGDEYGKFSGKLEDTEDQEYNHIKISIASNIGPCIL